MRLLVLLTLAQCVFAAASLTVENAAVEESSNSRFLTVVPIGNIGMSPPKLAPGSLVRLTFHPAAGDTSITDLSKSTVRIQATGTGKAFAATVTQAAKALTPIIAYVPPEMPLGDAEVFLDIDPNTSVSQKVSIVPTSLGIFQKHGVADAQIFRANHTIVRNGLTTPAHPGDYVKISVTGRGTAATTDISVSLGGKAVTAYVVPGQTGMDEIYFSVPADPHIPDACYLALVVQVAGDLV